MEMMTDALKEQRDFYNEMFETKAKLKRPETRIEDAKQGRDKPFKPFCDWGATKINIPEYDKNGVRVK